MTDISKYTEKILVEEDRPLFQEAVISARHGAPRGAYTLIWIACAEGLKRKFREAVARDSNANKAIKRFEEAESKHNSPDMVILDEAKLYGFIDELVYQKLKNIYNMRCVYAHPYGATPSSEELVSAAAVVVNEVLGQPTILGLGYVKPLLEKLLSDVSYLEHSKANVRSFARDVSQRIAPQFHEFVLKQYVVKLEPLYITAPSEIVVKRGLWFLSEFLLSVGCNFYSDPEWHDFSANYPNMMQYIILSDQSLFEAVGKRASDYVVSYVINHSNEYPSRLRKIEKLGEAGLLSNIQTRKLQNLDIEVCKAARLRISTCYKTIITALKAHDWFKQNPAVDLIAANTRSEIAILSQEAQEDLGRNILQAADGESRSALAYIARISEDPSDLEQPFLKGLVFEAFVNEKLEFRLKDRCLAAILDLLTKQKGIEAELAAAIDTSKPKYWGISEKDYQNILERIKERPNLQLLADAFKRNRKKLIEIDDSTED